MNALTIEKVWNGYLISGRPQREVYSDLIEVLVRIVRLYNTPPPYPAQWLDELDSRLRAVER